MVGITDLPAALAALATAANTAATNVAWAVVGGNTYVVAGAGGVLAADNVVELVGTHTLTGSAVSVGGVITLV